jgi:hypothetical protein
MYDIYYKHHRVHFPDLECGVLMLSAIDVVAVAESAGSNMVLNDENARRIPLRLPILQDSEVDIMSFSAEFLPFSINLK